MKETDFDFDISEEEDSNKDYDMESDLLSDFDYGNETQIPMQKHNDLLKSLTNFDPFLRETFNNWLGLTWNEQTERYEKNKLINPIMNLRGAAWCLGFLKTYTRSNNIITNINHDDYKTIMGEIIEVVWLNLGTRKSLGIKSTGDLLRVCNELEHASALALMGAGDGKYNKFLGTTITRHENINPQLSQGGEDQILLKKPNFLNKLGERIKRGL